MFWISLSRSDKVVAGLQSGSQRALLWSPRGRWRQRRFCVRVKWCSNTPLGDWQECFDWIFDGRKVDTTKRSSCEFSSESATLRFRRLASVEEPSKATQRAITFNKPTHIIWAHGSSKTLGYHVRRGVEEVIISRPSQAPKMRRSENEQESSTGAK